MPIWLRVLAENQPITPMVDAVRALTLGGAAPAMLGHDAVFFIIRALIAKLSAEDARYGIFQRLLELLGGIGAASKAE